MQIRGLPFAIFTTRRAEIQADITGSMTLSRHMASNSCFTSFLIGSVRRHGGICTLGSVSVSKWTSMLSSYRRCYGVPVAPRSLSDKPVGPCFSARRLVRCCLKTGRPFQSGAAALSVGWTRFLAGDGGILPLRFWAPWRQSHHVCTVALAAAASDALFALRRRFLSLRKERRRLIRGDKVSASMSPVPPIARRRRAVASLALLMSIASPMANFLT